ncbi:MAG: hypothetical protein JOY99_02060 [Sphingomonadaceae bacterium]|nr:hypothetical protein [Sphingomonadaceae bacterium]
MATATRRGVLMLGAIGASAVITIRPALAETAGSVLNCKIPVPDSAHASQYIAPDGSIVAAGTQGAYPPAPRPLTGQEVRTAMQGGPSPSGLSPDQSRAYINYIRRLQQGQSGFTCYASLQSPRG